MKASVTYIPVAADPQPPAVPPPASGAQRITDPTLDRITQLTEAPGTSTARTFEYDAQHRLTEIKLNGVRERGYDLNDRNQRIREYSHDTKSYMQYTYDNQGQLTFYGRRETGEFEGGSPSIYFGGYTYDMVGNRLVKMWMGGDDVIYTPNVVNQYSKITEMENSWEPGIETEFAYNPDGCQLSSTGGWTYGWNGENRLISAENGDTRLEFSYDYMGRRFEKKVYTANVLTKHEKFVYDGYKLIQVLDALNSDAVTMAFAWHPESTGLDTPFSMTYDGETYYYVTDGNKNVMSLIDAAGTKAAEYVYDPFGRLLSSTGELAEINPFRFSSEYHDDETGLVYYNYRYYSPELGRWISRDPIEEEGGVNLYAMVGNNPIMYNDLLGQRTATDTISIFSLRNRNLVGRYSKYYIEIKTAYIDASLDSTLGLLSQINQALPKGVTIFKRGKVNVPGYLGSGFIAEVKSKNGRAMCLKTRWTQYVQRIDNSLGPYSQGPHFVLDYTPVLTNF